MSDRINAASLNAVAAAVDHAKPGSVDELVRQTIKRFDEAASQQEHELQARKAGPGAVRAGNSLSAAPLPPYLEARERQRAEDRAREAREFADAMSVGRGDRYRTESGRATVGIVEAPRLPPDATIIGDRLSMLIATMGDLADAATIIRGKVSRSNPPPSTPDACTTSDNVTIFERYDIALDEITRLTSHMAAELAAARAALS